MLCLAESLRVVASSVSLDMVEVASPSLTGPPKFPRFCFHYFGPYWGRTSADFRYFLSVRFYRVLELTVLLM